MLSALLFVLPRYLLKRMKPLLSVSPNEFIRIWSSVLLLVAIIFIASANSNPYKPLPEGWSELCFSAEAGSPSCAEYLGPFLHATEYAVLVALTARVLVWKGENAACYAAGCFGSVCAVCSFG